MFKDPKASDQDINLLLLGETGVGKSTLINSISNYFNHPDFKKAKTEKIDILIPVCLNLSEGDKVCGNPEENENHESGKSATQQVKVYLFPIKMGRKVFNLRLVDTPAVGDPRGMDQDNVNLDNILTYLSTLKKLHGICFVLKSNQTRFTKFVEYYLKEILTRLGKSASENIIFITTYSKTTQYTAGETKTHCLVPLVRDIKSKPPHASIPLSNKNIFAVDNEAFKALLEIQHGKVFSEYELESLGYSWKMSSKEIRRLLTYITGDLRTTALKPHEVENTISVNEVRFLIEQLATPIAEVSELIQDNLRLLNRHKKSLNLENQTVEQLKEQLHIPCVDLQVKELSQPVTVCTDPKCADIVKVNGVTQWHYRQRCHNPCSLSGIPKEMIGDPGLISCAAMLGENCMICGCSWRVHMHIYKETEKIEVQKEDQNVKDAIKTKEDAGVHIEKLMKDLNQRMKELESEGDTISKIVAKFSFFLQEHALTPVNDVYSDHIKQLIINEKHLGKFADPEVITKLEKLLSKHELLQKTFQERAKNFQSEAGTSDLTPQTIKNSITELYSLKYMGKTIEELIKKITKETQKNFSVVSQQIDLNKKGVEDEQYQKAEYSEYYEDADAIYEGDLTEVYGSEYSYKTVSSESRAKYETHNYKPRSSLKTEEREPKYEKGRASEAKHHQRHQEKDGRSTRSSKNDHRIGKKDSSRRSREAEGKSGYKVHDNLEESPKSRHHRREGYESDDYHYKRSSRSDYTGRSKDSKFEKKSDVENYDLDSDQSARSFDSRHNAKNSKKQRNSKSRNKTCDSDGDRSTRSSQSVHSVRRTDIRNQKKPTRNDENADSDDKLSRRGHNTDASDLDSDRSTRSSQNTHSVRRNDLRNQEKPKTEDENGYSDEKHSTRSSRSGHNAKYTKSKNRREPKHENYRSVTVLIRLKHI